MNRLLVVLVSCLLVSQCSAADKYALLIGVTTYQKTQLNQQPLKFPEVDATAVRDVLQASDYTVVTLLGSQATRDAITAALQELKQHGSEGGVVFIGLFGHGVQYVNDAYFCPWDTTLREVRDSSGNVQADNLEPDPASMIAMKQILLALKATGASNRVLFADCCRDDPSLARGPLKRRAFGSSVTINDLAEGTAALFACSTSESAHEHLDWGHGAFTRAFLDYYQALPNADDTTITTMTTPLRRRVEAMVRDKNPQITQRVNPILNGVVDLQLKPRGTSRPQQLTNSIGQDLVLIPAGSFQMGSPEGESGRSSDEGPQHRVEITKAFYMGRTEVTQGQWLAVMGTKPWKGQSYVQDGDQNAASYISWDDATEFCRRLSQREGKTYRLPTEAEWEYACRAGTTTRFHFGDDESRLGEYAWFDGNADSIGEDYAHRVGQKKPNAFGLYDMHGNVWEWCGDWFGPYASSPLRDPRGPSSGSSRVLRGGSWLNVPRSVRCAVRFFFTPAYRYDSSGFRVVLE